MSATDHRSVWGQDRSLPVRVVAAVGLAVVANVALVVVATAAGIAPDFRALSVAPVAVLSAVTAAGGVVVYWLLGRYAPRPDSWFLRLALAFLALSFLPDLALLRFDEAATVPAVVVLMVMHVVVAVVVIGSVMSRGR